MKTNWILTVAVGLLCGGVAFFLGRQHPTGEAPADSSVAEPAEPAEEESERPEETGEAALRANVVAQLAQERKRGLALAAEVTELEQKLAKALSPDSEVAAEAETAEEKAGPACSVS